MLLYYYYGGLLVVVISGWRFSSLLVSSLLLPGYYSTLALVSQWGYEVRDDVTLMHSERKRKGDRRACASRRADRQTDKLTAHRRKTVVRPLASSHQQHTNTRGIHNIRRKRSFALVCRAAAAAAAASELEIVACLALAPALALLLFAESERASEQANCSNPRQLLM